MGGWNAADPPIPMHTRTREETEDFDCGLRELHGLGDKKTLIMGRDKLVPHGAALPVGIE
jgi:hypothetical protein